MQSEVPIAGCHVLALDLTTSWSFERPAHRRTRQPSVTGGTVIGRTASTSPTNRRSFGSYARRKSSIIIDMDIPSLPPSEAPSPTERQQHKTTVIQEELSKPPERKDMDGSERHAGMGSLMMTAKQDVSVPEFDMNAFF